MNKEKGVPEVNKSYVAHPPDKKILLKVIALNSYPAHTRHCASMKNDFHSDWDIVILLSPGLRYHTSVKKYIYSLGTQ